MSQALAAPDFRGRIEQQGVDVVASGAERCRRLLNGEFVEWARVIRDNTTVES